MKKITCIIIALVVLMSISFASAEEAECQMHWEELTRKYADQLSPEERFIATFIPQARCFRYNGVRV